MGSAPEDMIGFVLFFLNLFPVRRIILEKSEIILKHKKYSKNSKIPWKNPKDRL
jgi:hypothetical protein